MPTLLRKWLLTGAMAAVMAALCFLVTTLYSYRVDGGSMEPTIPIGNSVVGVRTTGPFQEGDVITFRVDGHVVTHTFIEYNSDGSLVTRGDANNAPDRFDVHENDVIGKVIFHNDTRGVQALLVEVIARVVLVLIVLSVPFLLWRIWWSRTQKKKSSPNPA